MSRTLVFDGHKFPVDPEDADEDGLVALGGSLDPQLLMAAYRSGIFPWSSRPVVNWWSPDPRAVFDLNTFKSHRSLARSIKRGHWRFTVDTDFVGVMKGCADPAPGREETWITPDFVIAYSKLWQAGHAHSVEVWEGDELVGGVYGVAIGGFFGAESMFHKRTDASKAAIGELVDRLRRGGFVLLDAQVMNPHLARIGAVEMPRREYLRRLKAAVAVDAKFPRG